MTTPDPVSVTGFPWRKCISGHDLSGEVEVSVLPCMHFCCSAACLAKCVIEKGDETKSKCFYCSHEFTSDQVKDNVKVDNIFPRKLQPVDPKCTFCELEHLATSFCQQCNQFLCQECSEYHEIVIEFDGHTLDTNLEERKMAEFEKLKASMAHCSSNDLMEMSHFCFTCQWKLCGLCKQSGHEMHDVVDVKEELASIRLRATETLKLQTGLDEVIKSLQEVTSTVHTDLKEFETKLTELNAKAQEMLTHHRHALSTDGQTLLPMKIEEVRKELEKLSQAKDNASQVIKTWNTMESFVDDAGVLLLGRALLKDADSLILVGQKSNENVDESVGVDQGLMLNDENRPDLHFMISQSGSVNNAEGVADTSFSVHQWETPQNQASGSISQTDLASIEMDNTTANDSTNSVGEILATIVFDLGGTDHGQFSSPSMLISSSHIETNSTPSILLPTNPFVGTTNDNHVETTNPPPLPSNQGGAVMTSTANDIDKIYEFKEEERDDDIEILDLTFSPPTSPQKSALKGNLFTDDEDRMIVRKICQLKEWRATSGNSLFKKIANDEFFKGRRTPIGLASYWRRTLRYKVLNGKNGSGLANEYRISSVDGEKLLAGIRHTFSKNVGRKRKVKTNNSVIHSPRSTSFSREGFRRFAEISHGMVASKTPKRSSIPVAASLSQKKSPVNVIFQNCHRNNHASIDTGSRNFGPMTNPENFTSENRPSQEAMEHFLCDICGEQFFSSLNQPIHVGCPGKGKK